MKLYKVTIRSYGNYGTSYVVAKNPDLAYKKVRRFLDKEELCFQSDRGMEMIELLADTDHYSDCKTLLFI